ncbi:LRP2 binding protein [Cichlidogyrus casuarinus]|uniref:LRP2-binding protein n=1 Tax=Cichlidogyrus casuarinus TaxID=1844966 RepID=A0ABD2QHC6_9PLAT
MNGSLDSTAILGAMYYEGIHVKPDNCKAVALLNLAVSGCNIFAQAFLVKVYFKKQMFHLACYSAINLFVRLEEKFESDRKLIEKQDKSTLRVIATASFIYALCLYKGKGIVQDQQKANKFFQKILMNLRVTQTRITPRCGDHPYVYCTCKYTI